VGKPYVDGVGDGLYEDEEDPAGRRRSCAAPTEGLTTMDKKHFGSTLDSLFEELGELDEMNERLAKRIYADRLMEVMRRRKISLSEFARRMRTSRTSAKRLLDHTVPGVTLASLGRAARAVGMAFDPGLIEVSKQATYLKKYGPKLRQRELAKDALYARKGQRA
jgi:hypothetical protein